MSEEELDSALKVSQTSIKATDPDGIHPLMLRHARMFFKFGYHKLFNFCSNAIFYVWNLGKSIYPENTTKKAVTSLQTSYTHFVRKKNVWTHKSETSEKWIGGDGPIDDSQGRFRKRRSTGRCIYKVIDKTQRSIGQGKVATALFINLEKACNSIWIDGLMYQLREAGINSFILNIIDLYLRNISVHIEVGKSRSENLTQKIGLP